MAVRVLIRQPRIRDPKSGGEYIPTGIAGGRLVLTRVDMPSPVGWEVSSLDGFEVWSGGKWVKV